MLADFVLDINLDPNSNRMSNDDVERLSFLGRWSGGCGGRVVGGGEGNDKLCQSIKYFINEVNETYLS